MSKSQAKQHGAVAVTDVSSGNGHIAAKSLAESGFFARRIPFRHLLLCACAVTLAISVVGCNSAAGKKQPSRAPVEVAAVVSKPIRLSDEFNGRVASINSVDVRARVTGYVDKVAYREGDSVKRGDLLFVIDPRPFRDALESAKARLEQEQAAAAFAQIQEKRAIGMVGMATVNTASLRIGLL
jgi:membrane fusion protein, multidrug efflux system